MHPSTAHQIEAALAVVSVVMFVGSIVAVPLFLVRVPEDYFVRRSRTPRSAVRRVLTTLLGLTLVALGVAMLVLPGQGVLTILVGLAILELPLKDRVIARLLNNPKVSGAIDRLRHKAGKNPLLVPTSGVGAVRGAV